MEERLTTTPLSQPIPLGCDYWLTGTTKCAEDAIVLRSRNNESLYACTQHQRTLTKIVGI